MKDINHILQKGEQLRRWQLIWQNRESRNLGTWGLLGEVRKKGSLNSRILEEPRAGDYRQSW